MATGIVHDDDPGDISYICGVVEQDIEGILLGYGRDDNKELERQMVDECEKQMLLNTREKIFNLAKEKIVRCLKGKLAGKEGVDMVENISHEEFTKAVSFIEKWQLVPRRAEHKIAHDIIEMIAFTLGSKGAFPAKLLKEASLNKGSLAEGGSSVDLVEELKNDLLAAKDNVDIQVIDDNGTTQTHCISISKDTDKDTPDQERIIHSAVLATEGTVDAEGEAPKGPESAHAKHPVAANENAGGEEVQAPPCNASETTVKYPYRSRKVCTCADSVVKQVREMACQTDEDERPIFRSEFEHQTDYATRKMRTNEQNIKGILKWKSLVNNRFKDIERAHEREVIALRAQYRTLSVELAERKAKDRQKGSVTPNPPRQPIAATASEQMEITDEWAINSGDDSIWNLPLEQSTPAAIRRKQDTGSNPGNQAEPLPAPTPKPRGDRTNPTQGQARPQRSAANGARKPPQGSKQKAVRVDIEMMEEESSSSQSESSTESECEEPVQKKTRSISVKGGATRSGNSESSTKDVTSASLSDRLRSLSETPAANDVEMDDTDNSWAEMEEEPMLVEITERKDEQGDGDDGKFSTVGKNGKAVRFSDDVDRRGVKRGGQTRSEGKKRGESTKNDICTAEEGSESSSQEHDSFADIVNRYGRSKIDWNKKRREAVSTKKRNLKGIKSVLQKEVYIQGLDFKGFASYAEMEELIHKYCLKEGVPVIYMKIIPAKYDRAQVGCKLAVREMDFDRVMDEDFWPEDVTVREWRYKPRNGRGYEGFGDGAY